MICFLAPGHDRMHASARTALPASLRVQWRCVHIERPDWRTVFEVHLGAAGIQRYAEIAARVAALLGMRDDDA